MTGILLIMAAGTGTPFLGPLEDLVDLGLAALLIVPAWLGSAGLVRLLGDRLFPSSTGKAVIAGSLLLLIPLLIPVVGTLALCVMILSGWGTAIISGVGSDSDWLVRRLRRKTTARKS
jgi:hypothetical protein